MINTIILILRLAKAIVELLSQLLNEVTEKGLSGVLILLLRYSCRLFTRCKRPNSVPRASLSHPTKPFSVTSNS
ncbi:MAG: hypothetical protein NTW61_01040 [Candidatus Melainabacteria bacterium]|nr:hypothetical protein [Candidatus Melainabacteria bacterium]